MLVLPQDIKAYGQDPEKLEVAKAVRMSMSFPFFFEAVPLNGSLIVDGGVVSNFPVELFDSKAEPKWPTFGFKLMLPEDKNPAQLKQQSIDGPIAEFIAIVQTAMEAHDAYHLDKSKYVRTIGIDPLNIGTTDFSLSDRDKQALYQSGFKAAQEFLKTWDFEEYKKLYRSGKPLPTRREQLLSYDTRKHEDKWNL
jgi:NTE family protein